MQQDPAGKDGRKLLACACARRHFIGAEENLTKHCIEEILLSSVIET